MILKLTGFMGESPRTIPRLLPDTMAQEAYNTKLENGALKPIHQGRLDARLDAPAKTIFRHKDAWLDWDAAVDVVQGPVADDRIYFTGDGVPKILFEGETMELAVPAPAAKLTASISGTPDPDLSSTILYTYTHVTSLGEESEPAPVSDGLLWSAGIAVTMRGFGSTPPNRRITKQRIYRSQTSSTGNTQFYFIAERDAGSGDFVDDGLAIVEELSTSDFNPPPEGLQGLTALANGMIAGFDGKRLYFCEPYYPHAWPEKYVLTCDYEIVALGSFGSSVAILTTGMPYIASGTAPENMVMEKIEVNLPCISARGVVDLGYAVAYPSHQGLVSVSSSGASVVTLGMLTRDQWLQMNPYSFVAGQYSGRWMASYAYTDEGGSEKRGIIIIDLTGESSFLIRSTDFADAMHYDIQSGALYVLKAGTDIYEWDSLAQPYGEQRWRSKRFVIPSEINFGALLVEGDDVTTPAQKNTMQEKAAAIMAANRALIDAGNAGGAVGSSAIGVTPFGGSLLDAVNNDPASLAVTIYADGRPVFTTSKLNKVVRLPGGFVARTWEIEVRGNIQVSQITMATSASEMAEGQ